MESIKWGGDWVVAFVPVLGVLYLHASLLASAGMLSIGFDNEKRTPTSFRSCVTERTMSRDTSVSSFS